MAKLDHDDLQTALDLCESSECAGNPEICRSCLRIAGALMERRRRAERAEKERDDTGWALSGLLRWAHAPGGGKLKRIVEHVTTLVRDLEAGAKEACYCCGPGQCQGGCQCYALIPRPDHADPDHPDGEAPDGA